eukprot:4927645-Pleurochrysis_carterae.AAC.5
MQAEPAPRSNRANRQHESCTDDELCCKRTAAKYSNTCRASLNASPGCVCGRGGEARDWRRWLAVILASARHRSRTPPSHLYSEAYVLLGYVRTP